MTSGPVRRDDGVDGWCCRGRGGRRDRVLVSGQGNCRQGRTSRFLAGTWWAVVPSIQIKNMEAN